MSNFQLSLHIHTQESMTRPKATLKPTKSRGGKKGTVDCFGRRTVFTNITRDFICSVSFYVYCAMYMGIHQLADAAVVAISSKDDSSSEESEE
jgi:hypothetical protein